MNARAPVLIAIAMVCLASCGEHGAEPPTAVPSAPPQLARADHENLEYTIGGVRIRLVDGFAEAPAAPGSA
jgi:hypothetical protein